MLPEDKLKMIQSRSEELEAAMSGEMGEVAPDDFVRMSREYAEIKPLVEAIQKFQQTRDELAGINEMLDSPDTDAEMKEMADLYRMYQRYAESQGWTCETMSMSESDLGGIKEVIVKVTGRNVFANLKFESGVHRVQRVPETETGGRIHTSAATVAVLPEAEEVDVQIADSDIRVDIFRASGPGGQSVNTTDSAVRITHIPTGIVVQQQDEKSQHKNKAKAMSVLRSRIYEAERAAKAAERSAARKGQVGSGDRSERIRTYNFPQGRLTDHRINLTLYKLDKVLAGEALDEVIDALISEDQAALLAEIEGGV